jgi:hypothetical protein
MLASDLWGRAKTARAHPLEPIMSTRPPSPLLCLCLSLLAIVALTSAPRSAGATERVVLAEQFTSAWCGGCWSVGRAMDMLMDDYPDELIALQIHRNDDHEIPWGVDRAEFFDAFNVPRVWFDGHLEKVGDAGGDQANYDEMLPMLLERLDKPTDVGITLGAHQLDEETFRVSIRIELAADGEPKLVHVYLVQALDHYPAGDHHRNCLMQGFAAIPIDLEPAKPRVLLKTISFDETSWSAQQDIRLIAWAELPRVIGPTEVHQASVISWPLPFLDCNGNGVPDAIDLDGGFSVDENGNGIPDECEPPPCPADLNGDATVDVTDLLQLLGAWGTSGGPADLDADGVVNVGDLLILLGDWGAC